MRERHSSAYFSSAASQGKTVGGYEIRMKVLACAEWVGQIAGSWGPTAPRIARATIAAAPPDALKATVEIDRARTTSTISPTIRAAATGKLINHKYKSPSRMARIAMPT